jgi:hypothetical protein
MEQVVKELIQYGALGLVCVGTDLCSLGGGPR